jgi:hypothetical protein
MKDIDRNNLVESYRGGMSVNKLYRQFGISVQAVKAIIVEAGCCLRNRSESQRMRRPSRRRAVPVESIRADYEAGASLANLSRKYSIDRHTIDARLREAGTIMRSRIDAYRLRGLQSRVTVDHLDALIAEHFERGAPVSELVAVSGVSRQTIIARFKERGLKLLLPAERAAKLRSRIQDLRDMTIAYKAGTSLKQIARENRIDEGMLRRAFIDQGVPIRDWRDAGLIVWERMTEADRIAQVTSAHRTSAGCVRSKSAKLKAAATRFVRQSQIRPDEASLTQALRAIGYTISPQLDVGPYNVDVAIESLGVSVEIERRAGSFLRGKNRPGDVLERTEHLLSSGWSVLFIVTARCPLVFPDIVQKTLAFFELAGRNKPHHGKYGMIRGDGKNRSPGSMNFDCLPRVPGF